MELTDRGKNDQDDHHQADTIGQKTYDTGPEEGTGSRRGSLQSPELTLFKHPLVLKRTLVLELHFAHPPREDDMVQWKLLRPQMGVEEVDGEDKAGGKKGLVGVEDNAYVKHPSRKESGEKWFRWFG